MALCETDQKAVLLTALLNGQKPSSGFIDLKSSGKLAIWYPELQSLTGVAQSPLHHPEGDVWTHTMLVIDYASTVKGQAQNPACFMLAALCHDLGKPMTTTMDDRGQIHAYGHDEVGIGVARSFLTRIGVDEGPIKYVENMVELHMLPNRKAMANAKVKSTNQMFDQSICPEDLLLLAEADHYGKGDHASYGDIRAWLRQRLQSYRETMALPHVTEEDLVGLGVLPGAEMEAMLLLARKLRLSGNSRDAALKQIHAMLRKKGRARRSG